MIGPVISISFKFEVFTYSNAEIQVPKIKTKRSQKQDLSYNTFRPHALWTQNKKSGYTENHVFQFPLFTRPIHVLIDIDPQLHVLIDIDPWLHVLIDIEP